MEISQSKSFSIQIFNDDALSLYDSWKSPIVIISDGPYGVGGFEGDLNKPNGLDKWYEPHIEKWTNKSTPQTTLWFWCTEIGWATVHPVLARYGWEYRACNVWNKGIAHIAGNSNTKSLRQLPIVTEVCVQYVKEPYFITDGRKISMKEWLRREWERTGLPVARTNEACGVKNAATRKYFTKDHLWYAPPSEVFEKLASYANEYGNPKGAPYYSIDGKTPLTKDEWDKTRAKFYCPIGTTNVWSEPPVNGTERLKKGTKAIHLNQKPIKLMELIIRSSSDFGDVVWEPFGGLFTGGIAAYRLKRSYLGAEISKEVFDIGEGRLKENTVLTLGI